MAGRRDGLNPEACPRLYGKSRICTQDLPVTIAKEFSECTPGFMSHLLTMMKAYLWGKAASVAGVRFGLQRENGHNWQERIDRDRCVHLSSCVAPVQNKWGSRGCEYSIGMSKSMLALQWWRMHHQELDSSLWVMYGQPPKTSLH